MAKLYFPAKFSHTEAEVSEPTPRWAMRRTRPYATSSVLKSQRGKTIGQYVRLIQFICACVAAYTDGHVVIDVTASRHPSPTPPSSCIPTFKMSRATAAAQPMNRPKCRLYPCNEHVLWRYVDRSRSVVPSYLDMGILIPIITQGFNIDSITPAPPKPIRDTR